MEWAPAVVAALVGAIAGWALAAQQWRLYREPEYQEDRLRGRRLRRYQAGLALATALVAGLAFRPEHYGFGPALLTAAWCAALLLVSSTDLERRRIPNRVTYPGIVLAAALAWAWPDRSVLDILLGLGAAVAIGAVLFAGGIAMGTLLRIQATPFGLGDVKLIILMGLLLGWPLVFNALFIGVVLAGIPSLFLILRGRTRVVFSYGPYLAAGAVVVLLFPGTFL